MTALSEKPVEVSWAPLLLGLWLFFQAAPLRAESPQPADPKVYDTFTVYWENDVFAATDQGYTNGLRFTWSTPYHFDSSLSELPGWSRPWVESLLGADSGDSRAVSLSFGQSMYTPVDVDRSVPNVNDRPYAGYSYLAASFHRRSPAVKTSYEFQAGVIGPLAFAEEFQNWSHDQLGISRSQGWSHQLKNEPAIEFICERHWLLGQAEQPQGLAFDAIPHLGARLGNVNTSLNLGGELRWGWKLPHTFGTCPIRPGCESNSAFNDAPPGAGLSSWHLFTAVDGRAVLRDIFLDGNTFADSPGVERKLLVADFMAGVALQYGITRMTYSYVFRTKEFATQKARQLFGAVSVSWSY